MITNICIGKSARTCAFLQSSSSASFYFFFSFFSGKFKQQAVHAIVSYTVLLLYLHQWPHQRLRFSCIGLPRRGQTIINCLKLHLSQVRFSGSWLSVSSSLSLSLSLFTAAGRFISLASRSHLNAHNFLLLLLLLQCCFSTFLLYRSLQQKRREQNRT